MHKEFRLRKNHKSTSVSHLFISPCVLVVQPINYLASTVHPSSNESEFAQENAIMTRYNDFRHTIQLKNYLTNKSATLLVVEYVGNIPIRET